MPIAALVLHAAERKCAIPLASVIEVARPLPLVSVHDQPSAVLGAAVLRGEPVPVVDLARVLGAEGARVRRFVSLRVQTRIVALAVDDVEGVEWFEPDAFSALPPMLGPPEPGAVAAVAARDRELLLVLDSGRLLDDTEGQPA